MTDDYAKDFRKVEIQLVTGTTRAGEINIGEHNRLSDLFLMNPTPFVVLKTSDGRTFIIGKRQIVYVEVLE